MVGIHVVGAVLTADTAATAAVSRPVETVSEGDRSTILHKIPLR
jgi:hypothetical protein